MELPMLKKRAQSLDRAVVQSLHILQLPLGEIENHLLELAKENPILQISPPENPLLFQENPEEQWLGQFSWGDQTYWNYSNSWYQEEIQGWSSHGVPPLHQFYRDNPKSFTQKLIEQLRMDRQIPPEYLPHCIFIAESLDSRGYFTESLEQTAQLLNISIATMEQVLFLVQEMQPTGVAARNLRECLLLQLSKSPYFNQFTLELISQDPSCFNPLDFKWISELLGTSVVDAQRYWQMVSGFNPIPASGYIHDTTFLIPEAILTIAEDDVAVKFHTEGRAKASLDPSLVESLSQQKDSILSSYQQINKSTADNIIAALEKRNQILEAMITYLVAYQQDYFMGKSEELKPLSLGGVAKFLNLEPTWVSRAICDKYLLTPKGDLISLKSLLSTKPKDSEEEDPNRDSILSRLRMLIAGEDKAAPLSDAKLQTLLEGFSIQISRRTITKYRAILNIPNASQRKIKK